MISNKPLFVIGNSKFYLHHFLVIGILVISFSISFMIRAQGADYGYELNEFDPFFNLRATEFILDNGLMEYFEWHDDRSWHTKLLNHDEAGGSGGRNISKTSQVMLHITAASLYKIFGFGSSLYDFTILFPVIFGSLSTIVIFALVRVIGGTTAGLFASLFFAVSVPIILRGMIGWFKSEPLGIFYGLIGMYLFLSAIKSENKKTAFFKLIAGGIFLTFGISAWGGIHFFLLPLGIFFIALPFLRKNSNFILWAIPLFTSSLILTALMFERPGLTFVRGIGGFSVIGPTIAMVILVVIQKYSKKYSIRNGIFVLIAIMLIGAAMLTLNPLLNDQGDYLVQLPSFRYLNAINPFLTSTDPLVDSVAEHTPPTVQNTFRFSSILLIFAGLGVWLLFRSKDKVNYQFIKNDMIVFSLILGVVGVYLSSSFIRLELFSSISLIVLSSLGLAVITKELFSNKIYEKQLSKKKKPRQYSQIKKITQISFTIVIVFLFVLPISFPENRDWIAVAKYPPTLLNGGTIFNIQVDDWPDSLTWLKNNTPEDSVIIAWWDYGYWITTLGEKITIADNATLDTNIIKKTAKMFISSPDDAWTMLNEMDGDYVLVFIAAEKLPSEEEDSLYILRGGGDESKKIWFIRIAEDSEEKYLAPDGFTGTNEFWNNTILGKMIPFSPIAYVNPLNPNEQSISYVHGFLTVYTKNVKYPSDGDGPLKLVYESETLNRTTPGAITGVLIYEINKEYKPMN